MDEFNSPFFSSSSWSNVVDMEMPSWAGQIPSQSEGLLTDSMGMYEPDVIPSSLPIGGVSSCNVDKDLRIKEVQSRENINLQAGYMGLQSNMCPSTLGPMDNCSEELLLMVAGSAESPNAVPESASVGSNDTEASGIHPSIGESHSLSSIPQIWSTPSYGGAPSLSPVMGQDKLQPFGLQGEYVDTTSNVFGNGNLQTGNFHSSISAGEELGNCGLHSFAAHHPIPPARTIEVHSQMQLPKLSEGNLSTHYTDQTPVSQPPNSSFTAGGGCNGGLKPRVRARRGQATDPHSIAERLRREKISERMKNLQELVPNSIKSDKASMLDEIVEYVKFLQLQVKVLSMSRLGAAGAVVPLITEGQADGSAGVHLSPSTGQGGDRFDSPDEMASEEEVVKLMESNVNAAMQYLQTKGLCLMPIALASAISSKKTSSSPDSTERQKPNFSHGLPPQNNGPPGLPTMLNGLHKHTVSNVCKSTLVKQEDVANSREPKNKE